MVRRFVAFVAVLIALTGVLPVVATENSVPPPSTGMVPLVELVTDYDRGEVKATSWGDPGAPAAWYFEIYETSNPFVPVATLLSPFVYDAGGMQRTSVALAALNVGADFRIDVHVAAYDAATNAILVGDSWRIRSIVYADGAPGFPSIEGGGQSTMPIPGTSWPLFPYSWASLVPPVVTPGAEWVLIASGPTGLIPVN